jgi:hypothetical protein
MKDFAFRLVLTTTVLAASCLFNLVSGQERPSQPLQEQSSPPQKALTVAPQAQPSVTEAPAARPGPANICQDLAAFLQPKPLAPDGGPVAGRPPGQTAAGPSNIAPPAGGQPQQASGQSAPVPQTQTAPQPGWIPLEEVRAYAEANDLRACQQAIQKMRRAGVALPPGLIALAALKPDLLTSGK